MKKKLLLLTLCIIATLSAAAQTQHGIVKTIGRPGKPGIPLGNVTIRWKGQHNTIVSNSDGHFSITMPEKKNGDAIILQSVYKKGYELQDKNVIGRPQVFSTDVPIEIVMVNSAQLMADIERIENNAYRKAEKNYQDRLDRLNKQVHDNEITSEQYHKELHELQKKYEAYQSLISDLANRYAHTDYDKLDSIDYQINLCIENGELEKADSIIHTIFDPETVLERNRLAKEEIKQRIAFAQKVIDKANTDKEAIIRDLEYAQRVVTLSDILAQEYLSQNEKDKAVDCLQKSLGIILVLHGEDSEEAKLAKQRIKMLQQ